MEIFQEPITKFHVKVFKANTLKKMDHTMRESMPENGVRNCVHFCLQPFEPLERCDVLYVYFLYFNQPAAEDFVFLSRFHLNFQTIYYPNSPEDIRSLGLDTPPCSRGLWHMPQEVEVGGAESYSFWRWPEKIFFVKSVYLSERA